jgi:methylmalonyl-CoA/ethylmalonyl-CoA epimerase
MTEKLPFSRFHHIGLVVRDIDKAIDCLSSLGIGPFESPWLDPPLKEKLFRGKPTEYRLKMSNGKIGQVTLELIQPVEGESAQKEFLESHGEGIQHIGFAVGDLDSEVAKLVKKGAKVLISGRWTGGGYAYLEMDASGMIIELIQE